VVVEWEEGRMRARREFKADADGLGFVESVMFALDERDGCWLIGLVFRDYLGEGDGNW
jgi:hypothetical protein